MKTFVGRSVKFTDSTEGKPEELGYFLQLTHSINEDMDYAVIIDNNGKIKYVFTSEVTFLMTEDE